MEFFEAVGRFLYVGPRLLTVLIVFAVFCATIIPFDVVMYRKRKRRYEEMLAKMRELIQRDPARIELARWVIAELDSNELTSPARRHEFADNVRRALGELQYAGQKTVRISETATHQPRP